METRQKSQMTASQSSICSDSKEQLKEKKKEKKKDTKRMTNTYIYIYIYIGQLELGFFKHRVDRHSLERHGRRDDPTGDAEQLRVLVV